MNIVATTTTKIEICRIDHHYVRTIRRNGVLVGRQYQQITRDLAMEITSQYDKYTIDGDAIATEDGRRLPNFDVCGRHFWVWNTEVRE